MHRHLMPSTQAQYLRVCHYFGTVVGGTVRDTHFLSLFRGHAKKKPGDISTSYHENLCRADIETPQGHHWIQSPMPSCAHKT